MIHRKQLAIAVLCAGALIGCEAGKQRTALLSGQDALRDDLRAATAQRDAIIAEQNAAAARDAEFIKIAKMGVTTQEEILTLSRETNSTVKGNSETLEKSFREIYGVGVDLRSAIGETRLVIEINNDNPLRVHSAVPSSESEVVTTLPIGAVIFQAKKVSETWMRGVIFQEGQKTEVYFAAKYTKPLRDSLVADEGGGLEVGSTPTD